MSGEKTAWLLSGMGPELGWECGREPVRIMLKIGRSDGRQPVRRYIKLAFCYDNDVAKIGPLGMKRHCSSLYQETTSGRDLNYRK